MHGQSTSCKIDILGMKLRLSHSIESRGLERVQGYALPMLEF